MSMEIIKFEKSSETRLKEFTDILCCGGYSLSASGVQDQWKYYIESVIEPVGWQAMWQISRMDCEEFHITFPTIVFVEILGVDIPSLTATIRILGVQDDIDIPERCDVSMKELYPTLLQENNLLDIEGTANCLDQLRFFYEHIWFPWDVDENETKDWVNECLKSRMNLFYDMHSGRLLNETVEHIQTLLEEGRSIQLQLNHLKNTTKSTISYLYGDDTAESDFNARWIELQLRMEQIRIEVEALENPVLRNIVIKSNQQKAEKIRRRSKEGLKEICFIWPGGLIDEFMQALSKARGIVGESAFIKSFNSAQDSLDQAIQGDTILLSAGIHKINGMGGLKSGGVMMGMSMPDSTIVQESAWLRTLLDISAREDTVKLVNLTISSRAVKILLLVRSGTVYLKNCHLVGDAESKTQEGILVLARAKLVLEDCFFHDVAIAIVVNNEAEVSLINCSATGCFTGFKIFGEPRISLNKCTFLGCKEYGIIVEKMEESTEGTQVGPIALIESNQMKISNESAIEGVKGAVLIIMKNHDVFTLSNDCAGDAL